MNTEKNGALTAQSAVLRPRKVVPVWLRLVRRAEKEIGQGRLEQAVISLERALASEESYACALRVADLYRLLQHWQAAFEAAEKAAALSPAKLPAYEMALVIALEAGDQKRIIVACQALIKQAPHYLPAYNALGAAYVQLGDVDAAMRAASILIRLDPQNAVHHFKKALLCQHKGEIGLAVQEFEQALQLEPDGPHALAARESLEILDTYQLNQIAILAMEDTVFRTKLAQNAVEAAEERGFLLSDFGNQTLMELSHLHLDSLPEPQRPYRYN